MRFEGRRSDERSKLGKVKYINEGERKKGRTDWETKDHGSERSE